jgi:hypothetical protein
MAREKTQKLPIVVVYKKTPKGKYFIQMFTDIVVDDIISNKKRTSLIPDKYIIEAVGMGAGFMVIYKKQYNARVC